MSPPKKETLQIVAKGRARREIDVVNYVHHMLTDVGITSGDFVLTITTRIPSGGNHHLGIEFKNVRRNAVYMLVQYGDNGTRFECYLSSPEFKPSHLMTCISASSAVKGEHYLKAEKVEPAPIPKEVAEKFVELKRKVMELNQARQRIENIKIKLGDIQDQKAKLEEELKLQEKVANHPDSLQAERDFLKVAQIVNP
jgi:hypothetical protein